MKWAARDAGPRDPESSVSIPIPRRADSAWPLWRESEAVPALREAREGLQGPLRRAESLAPSAAPGLGDSGSSARGARAPANTVVDGKGAYSRQYGGGSSLGAVTFPTSRGQASGRGGAGKACSRPTPTPPPLYLVGPDPHLPSRKRGVVGGAQGS